MNRVFISYRSADGKKDAARLAVDLGRVYGDDQVYFDKHDLRGGVSWRAAIASAIGEQPVVLLLITPALFGATDSQGRPCIDREDDPIRNELLEAQKCGALLLPLLTEGMTMPHASALPAKLDFVAEAHALRLRTDDWEHDLSRVVRDLKGLGVEPLPPAPGPPPSPELPKKPRKWVRWAGIGVLGIGVLAYLDEQGYFDTGDNPGGVYLPPQPPMPQPALQPLAGPATLSGAWWLVDPNGLRVRVDLTFQGAAAQLKSDRTPIDGNPGWLSYAQRMRQHWGMAIRDIVYQAQGGLTPRGLEMRVMVYSGDGAGPLATGDWWLTPSPDGQVLGGSYRFDGNPSPVPVRLSRP